MTAFANDDVDYEARLRAARQAHMADPERVRLFYGLSTKTGKECNAPHRDIVTFAWVCRRRRTPVVPYESAILDYETLDADGRCYPESALDELLTGTEIEQLRTFLMREFQWELMAREAPLPIGRNQAGLGMLPVSGEHCEFILANHPAYDLQVPVWGAFSLH